MKITNTPSTDVHTISPQGRTGAAGSTNETTSTTDNTVATNSASTSSVNSTSAASTSSTPAVNVSSISSQLQAAQATTSNSVFATSKVNEIKLAISQGRFQVNSAKVADEKSKQLQMIFRGLRIDPEGKFEVFPSRSAKGMFRLVIRKDIFDGFKDETLFKQLMSYVLILQEKHAQSNPSKAEECADLLKMLEEKQKKNVKRF